MLAFNSFAIVLLLVTHVACFLFGGLIVWILMTVVYLGCDDSLSMDTEGT